MSSVESSVTPLSGLSGLSDMIPLQTASAAVNMTVKEKRSRRKLTDAETIEKAAAMERKAAEKAAEKARKAAEKAAKAAEKAKKPGKPGKKVPSIVRVTGPASAVSALSYSSDNVSEAATADVAEAGAEAANAAATTVVDATNAFAAAPNAAVAATVANANTNTVNTVKVVVGAKPTFPKKRAPRPTLKKYQIMFRSFVCVSQLTEHLSKYYPVEAMRIMNSMSFKPAGKQGSMVLCAFRSYSSHSDLAAIFAEVETRAVQEAVQTLIGIPTKSSISDDN